MLRNVILTISTAAILVLLFVGYQAVLATPDGPEMDRPIAEFPTPDQAADEQRMQIQANVADVELPGGAGIVFTIYDERTGLPIQQLRCEEWNPVAGTNNQVDVVAPELTMRLQRGVVVTVAADEGRLAVDRLDGRNARPKRGTLSGDVAIRVARDTDRFPASQPQATLSAATPDQADFLILMDDLDFDLDLGQLRSAGGIEVTSEDFAIRGVGLTLDWNQVENRIEALRLDRGDELVLRGGDLLGGLSEDDASAESTEPTRAATPPQARSFTTYHCRLTDNIVARHLRGEQEVGRVTAAQLRLLFDVGSRGAPDPVQQETADGPTTQPASAPASRPTDRLVVTWDGPLTLGPAPEDYVGMSPRRRLELRGKTVTLTSPDGSVTCGRLLYQSETRQVWLERGRHPAIQISFGDGLSARASSVYIEQDNGVIKLIGDVQLQGAVVNPSAGDSTTAGTTGPSVANEGTTIEARDWAILQLAETAETQPAEPEMANPLASSGTLESASFHGAVVVRLEDLTLQAEQLDTHFAEMSANTSAELAPAAADTASRPAGVQLTLTRAVASREAELRSEDVTIRGAWFALDFGQLPNGDEYPEQLDARGDVSVVRGAATISGRRLLANLVPNIRTSPTDPPPDSPVRLQNLVITGDAQLADPENTIAAAGDRIEADFIDAETLQAATVIGTAANYATATANGYQIVGRRIEIDQATQSLAVNGRSTLQFQTTRGLRGPQLSEARPVRVSANELLHIDGENNAVHFAGDVRVVSGNERLQATSLTILLKDLETTRSPWRQLRDRITGLLLGSADNRATFGQAFGDATRQSSGRKEPVRLIARDALIAQEEPGPGNLPTASNSIEAPELEVDFAPRIVRTIGRTTLLMLSRQLGPLDQAAEAAEDTVAAAARADQIPTRQAPPATAPTPASGLPSALMTDGPSQSALVCDGGLTYAIGEDGPERVDTVLFRKNVLFVHRAGRAMEALEEMLPAARDKPELLDQLPDRNTRLDCQRLELVFGRPGRPSVTSNKPVDEQMSSMKLRWMLASGEVYVRDELNGGIATIYAEEIEYDLEHAVAGVRGIPGQDARIYREIPEQQRFDVPAIGQDFVINLRDGTVQAETFRGQFGRP